MNPIAALTRFPDSSALEKAAPTPSVQPAPPLAVGALGGSPLHTSPSTKIQNLSPGDKAALLNDPFIQRLSNVPDKDRALGLFRIYWATNRSPSPGQSTVNEKAANILIRLEEYLNDRVGLVALPLDLRNEVDSFFKSYPALVNTPLPDVDSGLR
jgi:hypothetical protein